MSKHKSSSINLEEYNNGPELLMGLKNNPKTIYSDESTDIYDTVIKLKRNKLQNKNYKMKGIISSYSDTNSIVKRRIDSNNKVNSLLSKSSKKPKLLHNIKNDNIVKKKVHQIGKYNVLNTTNEISAIDYDGHSHIRSNEGNIKSIRNRRLKVHHLKIPNHETGKYIKPKGISVTNTLKGGFRIQLTLFTGKSSKYSKNTENFLDALWLFECAIILKDRPTMLSILLSSGNFTALLSYDIISNELDYYEELGRWVCKFSKTSQMSDDDMKTIIHIYDNLECCFRDKENVKFVNYPSFAQNGKTVTSITEPTRTNQIIELIQSYPESIRT